MTEQRQRCITQFKASILRKPEISFVRLRGGNLQPPKPRQLATRVHLIEFWRLAGFYVVQLETT